MMLAPVTPAIPGHPPHSRAPPAQPGSGPPLPAGGQLRQNPLQPAARHRQRHHPWQGTRPGARNHLTTGLLQPSSPERTEPSGQDQAQVTVPDREPHHRRYSTGNPKGADRSTRCPVTVLCAYDSTALSAKLS
jgi:hypothetical protein